MIVELLGRKAAGWILFLPSRGREESTFVYMPPIRCYHNYQPDPWPRAFIIWLRFMGKIVLSRI